jgi:hypothetical protein
VERSPVGDRSAETVNNRAVCEHDFVRQRFAGDQIAVPFCGVA